MRKVVFFLALALTVTGCGKRGSLVKADHVYGNWLVTTKNAVAIAPTEKSIIVFNRDNTYQTKLVRDQSVSDSGRINVAGYAIVSTDATGVTSDVTLQSKDRLQITRSTNQDNQLARKITDAERDAIFAAGQAD